MGLSFVFANVVILVLSFLVFQFLDSLNRDIESITARFNQTAAVTDRVRISVVTILRLQRRMLAERDLALREEILSLGESLKAHLERLEGLYEDPDVKRNLTQMSSFVDSLHLILSRLSSSSQEGWQHDAVTLTDLADKIFDSYAEFSDTRLADNRNQRRRYEEIIKEVKKNMMITLLIGLLGTIILGLIVPGKIALPFKKIKDAIRELQDCNFDVNIYYDQNDEIGEIAREMNKMIRAIKVFEELRANRISVENRKFDALANMVRKPILVANAAGELIYMNGQLYSLLQCQSEEVLGRPMVETVIPKSIIQSYELAIKRRSKIENEKVLIPAKKAETAEEKKEGKETEISEGEKKGTDDKKKEEKEGPIFEGYANVIPIRGKESSRDYYLMILSKKVITV